MFLEKIVIIEGVVCCIVLVKFMCCELIVMGKFMLGNKVLCKFGLKSMIKKVIFKLVKSGGRINFKSFSIIFLLLMSNYLMMV